MIFCLSYPISSTLAGKLQRRVFKDCSQMEVWQVITEEMSRVSFSLWVFRVFMMTSYEQQKVDLSVTSYGHAFKLQTPNFRTTISFIHFSHSMVIRIKILLSFHRLIDYYFRFDLRITSGSTGRLFRNCVGIIMGQESEKPETDANNLLLIVKFYTFGFRVKTI